MCEKAHFSFDQFVFHFWGANSISSCKKSLQLNDLSYLVKGHIFVGMRLQSERVKIERILPRGEEEEEEALIRWLRQWGRERELRLSFHTLILLPNFSLRHALSLPFSFCPLGGGYDLHCVIYLRLCVYCFSSFSRFWELSFDYSLRPLRLYFFLQPLISSSHVGSFFDQVWIKPKRMIHLSTHIHRSQSSELKITVTYIVTSLCASWKKLKMKFHFLQTHFLLIN